MNRAVVALAIMCVLAGVASAESFDIASYAAPRGWSKQDAKDARAFTMVDKKAGTFCRITLHASMQTLGSSKLDFDADWRDLIATPYQPTATPKIDARDAGGWQVRAGTAPFDWQKHAATAVLVMMTNARTRFAVSYLATGDCLAQLRTLVDSLELKPIDAAPAANTEPTAPAATTAATAPSATTTTPGAWTVSIQNDFVEARQGKVVVRLHHATPIPEALRGDPEAKRDHFWNTLVAARYADVKNVSKPRIEAYATSEMMEADASELATKQRVHVAFHMFTANGVVSAVEVLAPSKEALDAVYADATKVAALRDLNRFAISAAELAGSWRDSSGSFLEYYNVYSGNSAGLAIGASTYKINFSSKGTFASQVKAVSGRTGSLSFGKENRTGGWKIVGGWTLVTKSGSETRSYDGWFEAVRGGRILHLVDQKKSGMHDVLVRQQ